MLKADELCAGRLVAESRGESGRHEDMESAQLSDPLDLAGFAS